METHSLAPGNTDMRKQVTTITIRRRRGRHERGKGVTCPSIKIHLHGSLAAKSPVTQNLDGNLQTYKHQPSTSNPLPPTFSTNHKQISAPSNPLDLRTLHEKTAHHQSSVTPTNVFVTLGSERQSVHQFNTRPQLHLDFMRCRRSQNFIFSLKSLALFRARTSIATFRTELAVSLIRLLVVFLATTTTTRTRAPCLLQVQAVAAMSI